MVSFFFGILGSIFRWGLACPDLDGQTFTLLFENFDIYHTSEQFFLWVLALTAFPAILYLTVKLIRTQEFDWHPNRIGLISLWNYISNHGIVLDYFPNRIIIYD